MERELLLLGLLREQRMHGYQLLEFIENQMSSCVDLKKPTAYFLLDKMTASGWIRYDAKQEGNRPPRHVYQLTPQGEAEFQRLLRENLATYLPTRFSTDVGLAFADALPPEEVLALLSQRRTAMEQQLAEARSAPEHAGSTQLLIEHRIVHLTSELAWIDRVIARFSGQARAIRRQPHPVKHK